MALAREVGSGAEAADVAIEAEEHAGTDTVAPRETDDGLDPDLTAVISSRGNWGAGER